jgi:hypothetical protein
MSKSGPPSLQLPPYAFVRRLVLAVAPLSGAEQEQIRFLFLLVYPDLSSDLALAENPVEHHLCVLENMMLIAGQAPTDPLLGPRNPGAQPISMKRAATLSLLHDVAPVGKISKRQIREIEENAQAEMDASIKNMLLQKAAMLKVRQSEFRTLHMRKGSALAQERMLQLNQLFEEVVFGEQDIEAICETIRVHDNPSLDRGIDRGNWLAVCFREADRLWMMTREGILADLSREGKPVTESAIRERAQQNGGRHREEGDRCYPGDPSCIKGTFYRTAPGYGVYERWCRHWGVSP